MRKSILVFIALLAIFNLQAQQKKWTLQKSISHALDNNISVKKSELDLEAAQYLL